VSTVVAAGHREHHELTAEPSFDVPGSILRRILRRDSGRMIVSLQKEIAARAVLGTAALPVREEKER
jgi:hypothetical protein